MQAPVTTAPVTTAPVTGEVAEAAPVQPELTKGYSDYYAGNKAALDMSMVQKRCHECGGEPDLAWRDQSLRIPQRV